jgi:hypothetical protein
MRGGERLSHVRIDSIDIISPRQKITEIHGLVLAGRTINTPTTWENVEWYADHCPSITTKPGVLFITGCNLLGRLLQRLSRPIVRVVPNTKDRSIDISIDVTRPGEYQINLVDINGGVLWSRHFVHTSAESLHQRMAVDMSAAAQGVYAVTTLTPEEVGSTPLLWMP